MSLENTVFISYAREDVSSALRLYSDLKRLGISAWIDVKNLTPGQDWRKAITKAIKKSSYFIALLSSHSISKRGYVQKELKIAFEVLEEFPVGNDVFIIPARLDTCEVEDERLQALHWIDLFESYAIGFNQIYKTINKLSEPSIYRNTDFCIINKGGNKSYFSSYSSKVISEQSLKDFPADDLNTHRALYREWSKSDSDYSDYFYNLPKVFNFVRLGGVAILHISGNCGDQDNISLPGIQYRTSYNNQEYIVDAEHPYISGNGYGGEKLVEKDFSGWNFTDHGYLSNVPSFSTVILENLDGPSFIEFNLGKGVVLLTTITFGCCTPKSFDPGAPLTNLLKYSQYVAASIGQSK
jgi:hypothetical protein